MSNIEYDEIFQRQGTLAELTAIIREQFLAFNATDNRLIYSKDGVSWNQFYNSSDIDSRILGCQPLSIKLTAIANLGYPASDGYVLSSSTTGVLTWVPTSEGTYQPLDADLTAIAGLSTNGFAKRTGTGTWVIDTNTYISTSSLAGTSGQVARFNGANSVVGDTGLTTTQSGGITNTLSIGGLTYANIVLKSTGTYVAKIHTYLDGYVNWTFGGDMDGFNIESFNATGGYIDQPIQIQGIPDGELTIRRPTRLTTLSSSGLVKSNGGLLEVATSGDLPGGPYLSSSSLAGTTGQVAIFDGTNTVGSNVGLSTLASAGTTYRLHLGSPTLSAEPRIVLRSDNTVNQVVLFESAGTNKGGLAYLPTGNKIILFASLVDNWIETTLNLGGLIKVGGTTNRPTNFTGLLTAPQLVIDHATQPTQFFDIGGVHQWRIQANNADFNLISQSGATVIDYPLAIAHSTGGTIVIGGNGRPISLSSGSKLQTGSVDRITAAGGFIGTSLTVGTLSGTLIGSAGVVSALSGTNLVLGNGTTIAQSTFATAASLSGYATGGQYTITVSGDGRYTIASGARLDGIYHIVWEASNRVERMDVSVKANQYGGGTVNVLSYISFNNQFSLGDVAIYKNAGQDTVYLTVNLGNRNTGTGGISVSYEGANPAFGGSYSGNAIAVVNTTDVQNGAGVSNTFNARNTITSQTGYQIGNTTYGTGNGMYFGSGDNASFSSYNLKIKSWYGIGFESYDNVTRTVLDTRNGNFSTMGGVWAGLAAINSWAPDNTLAWFGANNQNNTTNGNSGYLHRNNGEIYVCAPAGRVINLQVQSVTKALIDATGLNVYGNAAIKGLLSTNTPQTFTTSINLNAVNTNDLYTNTPSLSITIPSSGILPGTTFYLSTNGVNVQYLFSGITVIGGGTTLSSGGSFGPGTIHTIKCLSTTVWIVRFG